MNWLQHLPKKLNANILSVGSFHIKYYSIMYIVAFTIFYFLLMNRIKNENKRFPEFNKEIISDYITSAFLGVIIGGRLGYVLFYNFTYYLHNPLEIINPFDFSNGFKFVGISGMSYHGGLIGVGIATIIFCKKNKLKILKFADFIVPAIPLGYTFGRIGNFINGELYGRPTSLKIGMYFPLDPTNQLRHPSQLYEAFFEGLLLFIILWNIRKLKKFSGFHFAIYLIGYGLVRFIIEFTREPDVQLGLYFSYFSMGQILSFLMIISGFFIIGIFKKRKKEN